ncbi:hypothetical protein [Halobacillus kuroshimensis]|uniref:hypothetical protein n=1 Tax=Halobacillus kuroshimensis TaxID=302481 RepID=UPI0030F6699D
MNYSKMPSRHGTGTYKEYDGNEGNMIMDHYIRENYTSEKTDWKMVVEETSFSTECGRFHGNGHVLNDKGDKMYQALQQFT